MYTTLRCCIAFDRLEPEGKKVAHRKERAKETERENRRSPYRASLNGAGWYNSSISLSIFYDDESHEECEAQNEQCDDASIAPWIFRSTPLRGEENAYDCGNKGCKAVEIHLLELRFEGKLSSAVSLGIVVIWNKGENDCSSHYTEWQVDVKA